MNYITAFFLTLSTSLLASSPLHVGPDVFYRSFREVAKSEGKSQEKGWLTGFQAGCDFSAPWQLYLGGDFRWAEGRTRFEGTVHNQVLNKFADFSSHTANTIINTEGRIGYTLGSKTLQTSPFFAAGWHGWMRSAENRVVGYDEWYHWSYLGLGMRSSYQPSSSWTGGLVLSLMRTKLADVQIRGVYSWPIILNLAHTWQYEAELPISWIAFPYTISWTGYFRYLPVGKSDTQRTSRGEIFVPPSLTYVLGNRLECAYVF